MDFFTSFGDRSTEAAQRQAEANGETLPTYDGSLKSDTSYNIENESKQKTVFYLNLLFQLSPSTAGAAGMDDNNSIGTCATGVTNATTEILQEANNTASTKIIDT